LDGLRGREGGERVNFEMIELMRGEEKDENGVWYGLICFALLLNIA